MFSRIEKSLSHRFYPPVDFNSDEATFVVGNNATANASFLKVQRSCAAGFYMLECVVKHQSNESIIQFSSTCVDDSRVLNSLLVNSGCLCKRIVFIPAQTAGWQLNMVGHQGESLPLSAKDCAFLRLVPLRRSFARSRMLRRLGTTTSKVKKLAKYKVQLFSDVLYQAYDRSFTRIADEHYQQWIDHVETEQLPSNAIAPAGPDYHYYFAPNYRVSEHAKSVLAKTLDDNPAAMLVFADEDQLSATGSRKKPWFKAGWNSDLFLAQDYISACYACRSEWYQRHADVFECLGPRLALSQLLPTMNTEAILHIPKILVHRTVSGIDETQQPDWMSRRADVLRGILPADVKITQGLLAGSLRIKYPLSEPAPLVSLLIPTRDGLSVLKPCVESILEKTIYPNYEILILDNQSEQAETLAWLAEIARDCRVIVLKYDRPFNYSAINNFGACHAKGSVIGLINNDVEVISPDWLVEMVSQAMRPEIGCVGAKLYYGNGQIQHAGVILGLGDVAGHAHRFLDRDDDGYHGRLKLVQNYSAVTAACLLVRREIYEEVGGLEEKYLTVAYNDVDFCIRVREAGYRNLWTPYAELYHHESISRGEDDTPVKQARYKKEVAYMHATWKAQLADDPCYNPNLCRRREDFSLPDVLF